jgi:hypothetical protein
MSNCVAVHITSRGIACLVSDYLTPTPTETDCTISLTPLRNDQGFIVEVMTIQRYLLPQSSGYKDNSNPKMKAAGFSETPVTGYHTRCHTPRDINFHEL